MALQSGGFRLSTLPQAAQIPYTPRALDLSPIQRAITGLQQMNEQRKAAEQEAQEKARLDALQDAVYGYALSDDKEGYLESLSPDIQNDVAVLGSELETKLDTNQFKLKSLQNESMVNQVANQITFDEKGNIVGGAELAAEVDPTVWRQAVTEAKMRDLEMRDTESMIEARVKEDELEERGFTPATIDGEPVPGLYVRGGKEFRDMNYDPKNPDADKFLVPMQNLTDEEVARREAAKVAGRNIIDIGEFMRDDGSVDMDELNKAVKARVSEATETETRARERGKQPEILTPDEVEFITNTTDDTLLDMEAQLRIAETFDNTERAAALREQIRQRIELLKTDGGAIEAIEPKSDNKKVKSITFSR